MEENLYHNKKAQWGIYLLFFALLALVPTFVDDSFALNQFARYCVFGMLSVSVALVWGYGGILSFGQGIAFGVAAYGMAMTMQLQSQDPVSNPVPSFMLSNELEQLPTYWQPFWSTSVGLLLSFAVPTCYFVIFALLTFQARVSGVYFAILTLAELSAWYSLVYDMQPFTGGFPGISPPNPLKLYGADIDPYTSVGYWIAVGALAIVTLGTKLLLQSKFGLILQAIRDDPARARHLGYSVSFYQTVTFVTSGAICALAGICWVMLVQFVSPTAMEVGLSVAIVIWAALGGRMSLLGAIIGAFLVNGMQSYLGDELLYAFTLVMGFMFIVIVRFLPKGLAGLFETLLGLLRRGGAQSPLAMGSKKA